MKLRQDQRQLLKAMMEHPGWRVLTEVVIPSKVREMEARIASERYERIEQVWAEQAKLRFVRGFAALVKDYADGRAEIRPEPGTVPDETG